MAFITKVVSVLVIANSETFLDAVKDFTALTVLSNFDNDMYNYIQTDCKKELISKGSVKVGNITLELSELLKIETTTATKFERNKRPI